MENIYTKDNWNKDGYLKVKVGQYVADDVIEELRDSVPPATYKSSCFQPGEAYTLSIDYENLYMTFIIDNGMWKYIGLCPKGSIHPQPEMDYTTLNESRQGLKSMKLFNIVKQHGGFKEKTPSFYLHDMTDDDIIGEVDYSTLDLMRDMDPIDWSRWAMQKGYNVGRGDRVEILPLKDDTWIAVIERGSNLGNKEYLNSKIGKKLNDRYKNRLNRGDKNYQWSDTGKWGSPRAEEFYMRRTQNDIANQRRQRYGDGAVYKLSEHILTGLDKFATTSDIRRFTDSVIKKLYRVSQPYTSHRFRDNDWRSLRSFVNILREVYGVKELNLSGTGPYKQSQEGAYKEYTLDITTTLGSKIGGFIRCHFCGSQENPWDVYDMTVNFYRNNETNNDNIMMNESKQGIQSKKLYDALKEHGGFSEDWKNKMYVHGITDNDIIGIYSPEEYKKFLNGKLNYRDLISNAGITPVDKLDRIKTCSFKDGFKIIYILRNNNNIETTYKKIRRGQNAPYSSGKRPYMYSNKDRQNKVNKIKNNMSKIVLNENDLKAIINESVAKVINEAIQNGELDEGFWSNISQGFKGALGGDVKNATTKLQNGFNRAKEMGQNAMNTVRNAGQKVAGAAQNAYSNVQKGVNQRVNAFKANYAAGQNADKINNVIATLRELQQAKVISGAKTNATIDELERLLNMGMKGMRGRATQASNRIGREEE